MKKTYLFLLMVVCLITGCKDDDDGGLTLSLDHPAYVLDAEAPLEIVLNASENVKGLTAVSFRLSGTAIEGEDYIISDDKFVFLPATQSARIRIIPKENYIKDRTITLTLVSAADFSLMGNSAATISVEARRTVVCNLTQSEVDLYDSRLVKIKVMDGEGQPWVSENDLHIPFVLSGTAQAGTHYTLEKDAKEFVIPAGKDEASVVLKYGTLETGKNEISLKIVENAGIHTGQCGEIKVRIVSPNMLSDMVGVWKYDNQFLSLDLFSWWVDYPEDLVNLPDHLTSAGTIRFISGENDSLALQLTGDLVKYFRNAGIKFLKESDEVLMEQDWLDARVSWMMLSRANINFSDNHVKERPVMIGFRFPDESKDVLEVRIVDYVPTDFLTMSYEDMLNSLDESALDYPMKDFFPLVFNFRRQ